MKNLQIKIKSLFILFLTLLAIGSPFLIARQVSAASASTAEASLDLLPVSASLSAGLLHSAMINYDRRLYIWGDNTYGQLGLGVDDYYDSPQWLEMRDDVAAVSLGGYHSLVLLADGSVWSFGRNAYGQLGIGSTDIQNVPVQVEGLPSILAISAGFMHSMALGADGSVWVWGNNTEKQVGDVADEIISGNNGNVLGRRRLTPAIVVFSGAVSIAAGGQHSMYLNKQGQVFAWGDNRKGQLGDGTSQSHASPLIVPGLENVTEIAAGFQHSLAVVRSSENDILMAWGDDSRI